MPTKLRLQSDTSPTRPTHSRSVDGAAGEVRIIPFPAALAAARTRLVGAKVQGGPFTTPLDDRLADGDSGVIARLHADDPAARVTRTDELVRGIERTLDRMQSRLDQFERDAGECLKFPVPADDPGPRAA